MNSILALIVAAGVIYPGPDFNSKTECVKSAQEHGYVEIKPILNDPNLKIYCIDVEDYKEFTNKKITPADLKDADLVPELNK